MTTTRSGPRGPAIWSWSCFLLLCWFGAPSSTSSAKCLVLGTLMLTESSRTAATWRSDTRPWLSVGHVSLALGIAPLDPMPSSPFAKLLMQLLKWSMPWGAVCRADCAFPCPPPRSYLRGPQPNLREFGRLPGQGKDQMWYFFHLCHCDLQISGSYVPFDRMPTPNRLG